MNERITQRLAALIQEYEAGQRVLAELEAKQKQVQQTMLRIEGAIEVLKELQNSQSTTERSRCRSIRTDKSVADSF